MLDYQTVRNWRFAPILQCYNQRDTMLYALGVGFGDRPGDAAELGYVYERALQAVPTLATILGSPGPWWRDPRTGVNFERVLHLEQRLSVLRRLPVAATVVARNRVVSISDLGRSRGAVAVVERRLQDDSDNELYAVCTQVVLLGDEGGYSDTGGVSDPQIDPLLPVPSSQPELSTELSTCPQQALIYRLSGDYNPLHVDPSAAAKAGFPAPVLQGLCTFGIAAHAVLKVLCGYEAVCLRGLAARFSAPVYPGETLQFDFWRRGPSSFHLRARVDTRDAVVLDRGVVDLGAWGFTAKAAAKYSFRLLIPAIPKQPTLCSGRTHRSTRPRSAGRRDRIPFRPDGGGSSGQRRTTEDWGSGATIADTFVDTPTRCGGPQQLTADYIAQRPFTWAALPSSQLEKSAAEPFASAQVRCVVSFDALPSRVALGMCVSRMAAPRAIGRAEGS